MARWSEIKYINLTYSSPNHDIEDCMGLNPDGDVNVKYTLTSMRDKLAENVDVLNKLLEQTDNIAGLFSADRGAVAVCISSPEAMDSMFKNNLIRDTKIVTSDDESNEESSKEDHETHTDRLRMMKNLIFSSDAPQDDDSSDSSDSEYIDIHGMNELLDRYNGLLDTDLNLD